jgi:hypothetical protein
VCAFSPESLDRKNLRKLRFVIGDAFPMTVKHDHPALINDAEAKLDEDALPVPERAAFSSSLDAAIGKWAT